MAAKAKNRPKPRRLDDGDDEKQEKRFPKRMKQLNSQRLQNPCESKKAPCLKHGRKWLCMEHRKTGSLYDPNLHDG